MKLFYDIHLTFQPHMKNWIFCHSTWYLNCVLTNSVILIGLANAALNLIQNLWLRFSFLRFMWPY